MKRLISTIILIALIYFGYQWFANSNGNPEEFFITGEVSGNVMLLGKSFMEVTEEGTQDKYYVYSDKCCAEKGDVYKFQIKSSELARINEKSVKLYTELNREAEN